MLLRLNIGPEPLRTAFEFCFHQRQILIFASFPTAMSSIAHREDVDLVIAATELLFWCSTASSKGIDSS
jgi:hypothetical protein